MSPEGLFANGPSPSRIASTRSCAWLWAGGVRLDEAARTAAGAGAGRRPKVARGPVTCSPDERSEIRGQRSSLLAVLRFADLLCPPRASAPYAFASHAPRAGSRRQRVCRARPLFERRVGSIALRRDADEARHHPLAHAYRLDMRLAQHALLRFRADAHRKAIGLQRREKVSMAYDEETAARVRKVLSGRRDVVEKKMMGGLSFMADGAMFCSELTRESGANFAWEYCCQRRNV